MKKENKNDKNKYIDNKFLKEIESDDFYSYMEDFITDILNKVTKEILYKYNADIIEVFKMLNYLLAKNKCKVIDLNKISLTTTHASIKNLLIRSKSEIIEKRLEEIKNKKIDYSYLFTDDKDKKISEEEYNSIQDILSQIKKTINSLDIEQEWKQRILEALNNLIDELDRNISKFAERKGKIIEIADMIGQFNDKAITPIQKNLTKLMKEFRKFTNRKNKVKNTSNQIEMNDDIEDAEIIEKENLLAETLDV